jgi:hypothetical protein
MLRGTHRMSNTAEYRAWCHMLHRCNNPKDKAYHNYGGRGITVCEDWLKFENFYRDMGDRPSEKHSLDRIDNNGNYCKDNCRWATRKEQCNNRRSNRHVCLGGEKKTVMEWSDQFGLSNLTIASRLSRGWGDEDALQSPINKRGLRPVEYNGEIRLLMEWSEITGIHYETLRARLNNGWPIHDALTKPVKHKNTKKKGQQ